MTLKTHYDYYLYRDTLISYPDILIRKNYFLLDVKNIYQLNFTVYDTIATTHIYLVILDLGD